MAEPVTVPSALPTLWRNPAFMRLWLAQVLSNAGTQITTIAFPLTAVLALNATPTQMGLLGIAGSLPNFLFGLFAGVWVDRVRRRPILVGADIGRAILFASIPVAAFLGHLTFVHLVVVVFATTTLSVFFIITSVSVLPSLVEGDQLVEANSKLATSDSVLTIAGPSIAGALVQLVSAPIAIIIDALSYVLSAVCLGRIATNEASPRANQRSSTMWSEIGEGIRELLRTPLLRALTTSAAVGSLGGAMQGTVFMLFLTRNLHLSPAVIGLVFTCGGVGSLFGALGAGRTAQRIGTGHAVALGSFLWAIGALVPSFAGLTGASVFVVCVGQGLISIGATLYSINQMSLRQQLTPVRLMGRVTAARRFLLFSMSAIGAALGGLFGGMFGLRATLIIGAVGLGMSFLLIFFSPVRDVRALVTTNKAS